MPDPHDFEQFFMQSNQPASVTNSPEDPETIAINADDLDSGKALETLMQQYVARIRRLKAGLSSSNKEHDHVLDDYLMQNLELMNLNKNLEFKVRERTRELEVANVKMEVANQNLQSANHTLETQKTQLQELSETKEALMHMIVHDLKNPLTAVLTTLMLFGRNAFGLNPEIHDLLKIAEQHAQKLLSMIEEILFVSRMKTKEFSLKAKPLDLILLAQQSLQLMQKTISAKPLQFKLQVAAETVPLTADSELIERILFNLLNNAIKYAVANSEIVVEISEQAEWIWVGVTNQGVAIPAEHHRRVFELFARVNAKDNQFSGTGLGLAFCKLAVEAHQGKIELLSPLPNQASGVCFRFCLPKLRRPAPATA